MSEAKFGRTEGIGGPDRLVREAIEGLMLDTVQRGRRGKAGP